MSDQARDTQFMGFAMLLFGELPAQPDDDSFTGIAIKEWREEMRKLIAQRAYDLACHVASHTVLTAHGDMSKIPDLTTWPEVTG